MSAEHFFQSKIFRGVLIGLGAVAITGFIFHAGVIIGSHRALFASKWGENYYRNFGGEHGEQRKVKNFHSGFGRQEISGHGVLGSIISIKENTVVVRGQDDLERDVEITDKTLIKRGRDSISLADVKVGDNVMAFGSPDDSGRISATLIRVVTGWPVPPPR